MLILYVRIEEKGLEIIFHTSVPCKATQKVWKLTQLTETLKEIADEDVLSTLYRMIRLRANKRLKLEC